MAFELTPRQMRIVAAAVTTVAAVIILIAAGLLGWLIVLFVRTSTPIACCRFSSRTHVAT